VLVVVVVVLTVVVDVDEEVADVARVVVVD
jgi:hypothetical protein